MPISLPPELCFACRRLGIRWPRQLLLVWVGSQRMDWLEGAPGRAGTGRFRHRRRFVISTSRFGTGQVQGSHRTPLGLHQVARKVGQGWPLGAVFVSRTFRGFAWNGQPKAPIAHRILWLAGLEPGRNQGGEVDSFRRFIYLHGVGDESGLGRPASIGCIHLAASDLMPLFDRLTEGTLVWISPRPAPLVQPDARDRRRPALGSPVSLAG